MAISSIFKQERRSNKMAKKSKTSFKKENKETKDTNMREEYSKELNQVIHNNAPQKVTKHRAR